MFSSKDRVAIGVLFNAGTYRDLTDGQLLERFATARGEAAELAFAVVVERHGPMVLRACRSVLLNPHDVDDAFQATFLVLARQGRSLWVRDSLGPWLHQVAFRTAKCVRATASRRRRLEAAAIRPEAIHDAQTDDLAPLLHEEIERLPERYRAPIILCDLQGHTHEQAARHLGWPVGTVKSRQSRAREKLRNRLQRRGVTPESTAVMLTLKPSLFASIVPPALAEATALVATQSLTPGALVGTAALLALEVAKTMTLSHWWKLAASAMVAGATVAVAPLLARQDGAEKGAAPAVAKQVGDDATTTTVKPGQIRSTVSERGYLEASKTQNIINEVEGTTTIISLRPEGERVKKGDLIAELDAATLRDNLVNQQIATRRAQEDVDDAKKSMVIASLALTEYTEGTSPLEQASITAEIQAAESVITKAERRLKRTLEAQNKLKAATLRNAERGPTPEIMAELDLADRVEKEEGEISTAKSSRAIAAKKLEIFEKYKRRKAMTLLEADLKKAESAELVKRSMLELQKAKEDKLRRMIERTKIYAPADGVLVYANSSGGRMGAPMTIEEGATVRERQVLFRIPDLSSPLRVNARASEAFVDRLKPGQAATIKVDAFPDETLVGTVSSVAPMPDPPSPRESGKKVYPVTIDITKGLETLRPGMTAEAVIVTGEVDNALVVPVSAVVYRNLKKPRVIVKKPDGGHEWREIKWGLSDGKVIEIKSGLKAGDVVFDNPATRMTAQEMEQFLERADRAGQRSAQP